MSNGTGTKKYHQIAVGWIKQGQKGEYISCSANGQKSKVKLFAELADGTQVPVNSFAAFFKTEKPSEKAPDVEFTFTTEQ